jgi:Glycosyl hydrolases family 39
VHNASGEPGEAMKANKLWRRGWWSRGVTLGVATAAFSQTPPIQLNVHWDKTVSVSQTTPTLQVVVNPPLRRGTAVHDQAFQALRDLNADYVRYVPWLPYPKLGIAELEAPKDGTTSWDFSFIDPMTIDFLEATRGHPVTVNFSTIPAWMFKTDKPVEYPNDPNQVTWTYTQGTELRDPTFKEPADYYGRLLAWYTQGGFIDEFGKPHHSGFHYKISHWEVLNELELEHQMTPETYTKFYDAVVTSMHKVSPETKFVGLALAYPPAGSEYFEYFLNPAHHAPGVPLDYISYHFYAIPTSDQSPEIQQFTFFAQADGFLNTVGYIEQIRKRLSPETKTMVNEIGAISADDLVQGETGHVTQPISNSYWGLAGAVYAYIFGEFTRMGIDVAGESQLVGFPTQFPSVSMVDWNNGKPNPRYWVLKLLKDQFGPGDKVVEIAGRGSGISRSPVYSMAVVTKDGKKRVLLVNERDHPIQVGIPGATGGEQMYVDQTTAFEPPATTKLNSDEVMLNGYSVSAVTLP